jgi:hypothetical protein
MGYRLTMQGPVWTFDPGPLEMFGASFSDANGVATQTDWDAFIAGMSPADVTAAVKGLLSALTCSVP